jgi:hypothetical protein
MKGIHAPVPKGEMFKALFEYRTIKAMKYGKIFEIDVWCFNEKIANGIVLDAPPESGMKGKYIEVDMENIISAYDRWEKPEKRKLKIQRSLNLEWGKKLIKTIKQWMSGLKTKLKNLKT